MNAHTKALAAAALSVMALSGTASAEAAMDSILDEAMPYMHHSCESVILTHEDEPQAILDIVELMVMVSLYNRELVVTEEIEAESDREAMHAEFVEELEEACDDDPGMLLAGAVDIAVKETFAAFD